MNIGEHEMRVDDLYEKVLDIVGDTDGVDLGDIWYTLDLALSDAYQAGECDGERRADRLAAPGVQ